MRAMLAYVASTNAGKIAELREVLARSSLELREFPGYQSPVEDAPDYRGNARIKARALRAQLLGSGIRAAALADDSGLEVDALAGRPGIYSARYGGSDIVWERRRALLLEELRGVPDARRKARFVCALVLVLADGKTIEVQGSVGGFIAVAPAGNGGFGYDALFFYPPHARTFSQLSAQEKNAVSHRRAAADALACELRKRE